MRVELARGHVAKKLVEMFGKNFVKLARSNRQGRNLSHRAVLFASASIVARARQVVDWISLLMALLSSWGQSTARPPAQGEQRQPSSFYNERDIELYQSETFQSFKFCNKLLQFVCCQIMAFRIQSLWSVRLRGLYKRSCCLHEAAGPARKTVRAKRPFQAKRRMEMRGRGGPEAIVSRGLGYWFSSIFSELGARPAWSPPCAGFYLLAAAF